MKLMTQESQAPYGKPFANDSRDSTLQKTADQTTSW